MRILKNLVLALCVSGFLSVHPFLVAVKTAGERQGGDEYAPNERAIERILGSLSLAEKVNMLCGNNLNTSPGIERLGIEDIVYTDGPSGVREELANDWSSMNLDTDYATFFPTGTALAATWNPELAFAFGEAIGEETKMRGKDILLGPNVNLIRTPLNGRNYEAFTEDPLLNAEMGVAYIKGVQTTGVSACLKHYALNNQEDLRKEVDVYVDERALRELYLPAYKAGVQEGGVWAVMAAYNKFRGSYCAENEYLLKTVLKDEWGFQGMVMSDWGGTHSMIESANNGLDVEMGSADYFTKDLVTAVEDGRIAESVIDDKVRRILRLCDFTYRLPGIEPSGELSTPEHNQTAYDVAAQSVVLLKNSDELLPLKVKKLRTLAVIGDNAIQTFATGGFGAGVKAKYEITLLEGLKDRLGNHVAIKFAQGYIPKYVMNEGALWKSPLFETAVDEDLIKDAEKLASKSDAVVLVVGNNREIDTEHKDRERLSLPFAQDVLIERVCAANPNTVVVVISGGPVDLKTVNANSTAILWSGYNGSEAGHAVADVLLGTVNPSGKLPFTFPEKLEDSPAHATGSYSGNVKETYKEGLLVGYRWHDTKQIVPQYCFGHGLSYTSFSIGALKVDKEVYDVGDVIHLSIDIQNTGDIDGHETLQLYVRDTTPEVFKADRELKAFCKVLVPAGKTRTAVFEIPVEKLAWYSGARKEWVVSKSKYELLLGTSSRNTISRILVEVR